MRIKYLLLCWPLMAWAGFDLSLNYDYYLTPSSLEEPLNHYTSLGLDMKHSRQSKNWFYGAEAVSLFFLDVSNQKYLALPELFFGYELTGLTKDFTVNLIFGRYKQSMQKLYESNSPSPAGSSLNSLAAPHPPGAKPSVLRAAPEFWSVMDEVWEMGLWQSQINWDYLLPQQQGLAGLFLTVVKEPWLLTGYASGLFLPDHGPAVNMTSQGKIHSGSRWFVPPQSNFVLFNQTIDSLYWMEESYLKNILLNDSYAVRFRFGDLSRQWISASYALKPVNQIYFTIDSGLSIKETAINNIIYYQLFNHTLKSLDVGIREKYLSIVLSIMHEEPESPPPLKGRIVPVLPEGLFFSSHARVHFPTSFIVRFFDFNFIYSHFDIFSAPSEKAASARPEGLKWELAHNRFKVSHGWMAAAQSRTFRWKNHSMFVKCLYQHSIPEEGGRLSAAGEWAFTSRLRVAAYLDILGGPGKTGFFNTYKQNDRFKVEVRYAVN